MPELFKKRILKYLTHDDYRPVKLSQLAKALNVASEDFEQFKAAFDQLRRAGHVVFGSGNVITLPAMSSQVVGTFRANPKGFGFITPREPNVHGDLFVPPGQASDAMNGDVVLAKVSRKGKRAGHMRYTGQIVSILERAQNRFVGTLEKHEQGWLVHPDGSSFFDPISVEDVAAKNARLKDKVVVEILSYPTEQYLARGVIVEVLGRAGRYETEIRSIVRQYHLPGEFDPQCVSQARLAAGDFDAGDAADRENITDKIIITIDPPDAKDFDDAISLERDDRGNWVLGVHIADVSHFVTPDSALDVEARQRGNSVYLPGRTIPMLPEILSNGICSLQPDQLRFAKSVYITCDSQGKVVSRRFTNSLIRSTERLTYVQADRILRGRTSGVKPEVAKLLADMEILSRAIEQRRRENGMLHLDLQETELVMDDAGQVVDACPAENSYPHTMIEMFMVEANEAVAGLLDRHNVSFLRRIHPEPDPLSMKNLSQVLRAIGYALGRNPDRVAIRGLLETVQGTDASLAVNLAVLRSFEKAQYAPLHIGHYALASTHYCHFTSPIRRYADLVVHRLLQHHIEGHTDQAQRMSKSLDLTEIGRHITLMEQRAEDAERELRVVLVLQMLSKRIGDQLDCVVTGLTGFGVFVQSRRFGIEGLVQTDDLGPDRWRFNRRTQSLVGEQTGCTVRLGQSMRVTIASVNVAARQLNVTPIEPLVDTPGARRHEPKFLKRGRKGTRRRR